MDKNNFGCIGVLMGGVSSEREISLKSGKAVYQALSSQGYNVLPIDLTCDDEQTIAKILKDADVDVVFIALHGRFGEDGTLQQILDNLDIPYTGSGVMASKMALDKVASREIFKKHHLAVPRYQVLSRPQESIDLSLPLVVKPATHGSSIGLTIVDSPQNLSPALQLAFKYDTRVIIEEYIKGREVTVGILEEQALPVIEIVPKRRFFDFQAKYEPGTEYIVPAQLPEEVLLNVQNAGLRAHQSLGCRGFSRADIILSEDYIPFVLEINTIPGMTSNSLLPKAARAAGINFEQLVVKLIETALKFDESKT